ncbi:glycosyltransferase [Cognatishimia sp.]|uniref:glycosyltransferase n=1 Tax=Cognatishimia sp. TaxID=2211648 RepID=UPI00351574CB|nr:glycosyltransferase [Cognatishimia sp.]
MLGHAAYLMGLALLAMLVAASDLSGSRGAIVVIGALGAWRYSWAALNFTRAVWFRRVVYPKRKAQAFATNKERKQPARAHFLVTSYRIPTDVSLRVYRSVFDAAMAAPGGAQVVASVVDAADARLVQTLFDLHCKDVKGVRLTIDRIPGTGKRDALAAGLRLIAKTCPTRQDVVVLVDGDSCVPIDIVEQSAPFFTDPRVGGLTTDEAAEIAEAGLFQDWFRLRFDQRQVMMCSMGLSGRVLTLTGRMSVFRADLATNPEFIRLVQHDHIDHWRFGRLEFLTGDDKSTWYWLLKQGFEMAYLPDVKSLSMESQPKPSFINSAVTLMTRWFGNMLRTDARALALPRRDIGTFVWWSLLDQRISIWTTLAGPTAALTAALLYDPMILVAYAAWVLFTRYVFCTALSAFRGRGFPITYPVLLYFSQFVGALVKSHVTFRLDRQKWTRQTTVSSFGVGAPQGSSWRKVARQLGTGYLHALAVGWLLLGVFYLVGYDEGICPFRPKRWPHQTICRPKPRFLAMSLAWLRRYSKI